MSSGIVFAMPKRLDLNLILAHNLRFFMANNEACKNANALATKAGIAPGTVRNYLDHRKRTVTTEKPEGFPTLDILATLAVHLGCEVWELLHPDIERSIREREMYEKIETDFSGLASQTSLVAGTEARPFVKSRK